MARFAQLSALSCATTVAIAATAAAGWVLDVPNLTRVLPNIPAMQPYTIIGLILLAIAIHATGHKEQSRLKYFGQSLATIVAFLGVAFLAEYSLGIDFRIDQLLLGGSQAPDNPFPGRPAPQTAANLVLLGVAALLSGSPRVPVGIWQTLALIAGGNSLVSITGYLFEIDRQVGFPAIYPAIGIAVNTALCLILLTLALLVRDPRRGFMSLIVSKTHSGAIARMILLAATLAPPLLGMLTRAGVKIGWFDVGLQISVFVVALVSFLLWVTWRTARQAEEEELKANHAHEQRQLFEALIANSSDFIGIADASGKSVYVNPKGRRMVDLPEHLLIEDTAIPDYFPPEQRKFAQDVIVKNTFENDAWSGETAFRNWQTGESIPVLDCHFLIRAPQSKKLLGIGTITRNIAEQKKTQDQLAFLSEALRVLTETVDLQKRLDLAASLSVPKIADICIVALLEDGDLQLKAAAIHDPSQIERLKQTARIGLAAQGPHRMSTPLKSEKPVLIDDIKRRLEAGEPMDQEQLRRLESFAVTSFVVLPLLVSGRPIGTLTLAMTRHSSRAFSTGDLKFAELAADRFATLIEHARLYREAQRAKHVADNTPAMIAYWDKDLRCRFANRVYVDWFGYTPEQLLGLHMKVVLGENLFDLNWPYIEGALKGTAQNFERDLTLKSTGELRHTSATYIPEIVEGDVKGFFVLVSDITELKRAQLMAEHEKEVALSAVKMREEVLAIVSHDLKNPLAAISLIAQYLGSTTPTENVRQREMISKLKTTASQMSRLISDLLDFARLQAGGFVLERRPEDPRELISDVLVAIQPQAEAKKIVLSTQVEDGIPRAHCDRFRVAQALSNLLSNAVKFTPEAGKIIVRCVQSGEFLRFSVTDTGPGMPPHVAQHVFERYWQAEKTRKLGSGLGLAIAKGLVEAHCGTIGVETAEGKGSTFYFTVPIVCPTAKAASA